METDRLDEVDRQLVHALVIAPRAPFTLFADVIGVSDRTIARRYRKLVSTFGLRVTGVLNSERLGWTDWVLRLQVTPGHADGIAQALARRPDTRWITLASGGTEITCVLQVRTAEQRDDLFLRGLPGSRRVTQITAQSLLRQYSPLEWAGLTSTLRPGQVTALRASVGHPENVPHHPLPVQDIEEDEPVSLHPDDHLLLAELASDGRASHAVLATALHWHESTVRRRIEELQQQQVLYFDVDVSEDFLNTREAALLWLAVEPAHLDETGRAIARHPEVPFAAATTGHTNLVVSARFRGTRHMYQYITARLTGLSGIRSVETSPIIGRFKAAAPAPPGSAAERPRPAGGPGAGKRDLVVEQRAIFQ